MLLLDASSGLRPPCVEFIHLFSGKRYNTVHNLPHPGALMNTSWLKLTSTINDFLDEYDKNRFNDNNLLQRYIQRYEDIIYQATEFIENNTKNLKRCLLPQDRYHEWQPSILNAWEDHPKIVSNHLKHNHNILTIVEMIYKMGSVKGYVLSEYRNEGLHPNIRVHAKQNAFSFGHDLRRILAHIYLISHAIKNEVQRLFPNDLNGQPQADNRPNETSIFLSKVSSFMPFSFPQEKAQYLPVFDFKNETLNVSSTHGKPLIMTGDTQAKTWYSGDGYTKEFQFF